MITSAFEQGPLNIRAGLPYCCILGGRVAYWSSLSGASGDDWWRYKRSFDSKKLNPEYSKCTPNLYVVNIH